MCKWVPLAVVCLFLTFGGPAAAQSTNASISGNVNDASGAAIPGVSITAESIRTGVKSSTISNEAGVYNFPSLQPGQYRMSAELPGFQTAVFNDVVLAISAQLRLNFALQVAGVSQAVEVSVEAESPLATTTSSIGGVISGIKVRDLPLPARNALDLVAT